MTQTREDTDVILGYPAMVVRDVVRAAFIGPATASRIADLAKVSSCHAQVHAILSDLAALDIDLHKYPPDERADAISNWRAGKRITRAKAQAALDKALDAFDRMAVDRSLPTYPCKVWVFGSFVRDVEKVGDVDIVVEWKRRFDSATQPERFRKAKLWAESYVAPRYPWGISWEDMQRAAIAMELGRLPRALSVHDLWELKSLACPCREVWRAGVGRFDGRLLDMHPDAEARTAPPPVRIAVGDLRHAPLVPASPKGMERSEYPSSPTGLANPAVWLGREDCPPGVDLPEGEWDLLGLRSRPFEPFVSVIPVRKTLTLEGAAGAIVVEVGPVAKFASMRPMPEWVGALVDYAMTDVERLRARGAIDVETEFRLGWPDRMPGSVAQIIRDADRIVTRREREMADEFPDRPWSERRRAPFVGEVPSGPVARP